MATPKLEALSLQLSRTIHDPVNAGTTKGLIFTAEQRLDYINRGYLAMARALEAIHRDISFVLPDFISTTEIINTTPGESIGDVDLILDNNEIYDVFYQAQGGEIKRGDKIDAKEYYSVDLGYNEFYPKPIFDTDTANPLHYYNKAYWTILNGNIKLIPSPNEAGYLRAIVVHKKNFEPFVYGSDDDLDIAKDYTDVLLLYAAREAYVDDGNASKYQTTSSHIAEQLKVIGVVKAEYIRSDKNRGPK